MEGEEIFKLASSYRAFGGLEVQLKLLTGDANVNDVFLSQTIEDAFDTMDAASVLKCVARHCSNRAPLELLIAHALASGVPTPTTIYDLRREKVPPRAIASAFQCVAEHACGIEVLEELQRVCVPKTVGLAGYASAVDALGTDVVVGYHREILARLSGA